MKHQHEKRKDNSDAVRKGKIWEISIINPLSAEYYTRGY